VPRKYVMYLRMCHAFILRAILSLLASYSIVAVFKTYSSVVATLVAVFKT